MAVENDAWLSELKKMLAAMNHPERWLSISSDTHLDVPTCLAALESLSWADHENQPVYHAANYTAGKVCGDTARARIQGYTETLLDQLNKQITSLLSDPNCDHDSKRILRVADFGVDGLILTNLNTVEDAAAEKFVWAGKINSLPEAHPLRSLFQPDDLFRVAQNNSNHACILLGKTRALLAGKATPRAWYLTSAAIQLTRVWRSRQKIKDMETAKSNQAVFEEEQRSRQSQVDAEYRHYLPDTVRELRSQVEQLQRQLADQQALQNQCDR